jgi:3-hydroxybutyryl-CoA dehydrogenase
MKQVAVVGGGLMGSGIAQNAAQSGYPVTLIELNEEIAAKAKDSIKKRLDRLVEKEKIPKKEQEDTLSRITVSSDIKDTAEKELIIEAVPEDIDIKKNVFRQLDEHADEGTIIASNTSGLSIAAISAATARPEKVIGLHYFYPVPLMPLVEVIPSIMTDEQTVETVKQFAEQIGKTPVVCNDYPGFLVNRMLIPMVNEAAYCVMEGASPEDVDNAMMLGANHKMGPLTLADFVGLDVLLATMEGLYEGFKDSKYRPSPLLTKLVESGNYGRKTGQGFYYYNEKNQPQGAAI